MIIFESLSFVYVDWRVLRLEMENRNHKSNEKNSDCFDVLTYASDWRVGTIVHD